MVQVKDGDDKTRKDVMVMVMVMVMAMLKLMLMVTSLTASLKVLILPVMWSGMIQSRALEGKDEKYL